MCGRLTKSADFERVRKVGARWRGKYCALNAARAGSSGAPTRIGYIASKSLGNAVRRNRARRVLREAARGLSNAIPNGWDIVLIAHASIITDNARMQQVREDVLWLLNKAQITHPTTIEKSRSSPIPPAPASDTPSSTKC
jgi:ribonuclease P protein component